MEREGGKPARRKHPEVRRRAGGTAGTGSTGPPERPLAPEAGGKAGKKGQLPGGPALERNPHGPCLPII